MLGLAAVLFRGGSQTDVDAGTALRLDIPGLVEHAALVFEGRVRQVTSLVGSAGLIETEYVLDVQRTFEGQEQATRSFRLPGGVLPTGDGMILPGMPSMVVGEDVILFLTGESGSGIRMPVGLAQGKFRVETNLAGQKQLSRRQGSLSMVDGESGVVFDAPGADVFDYAQTIAEIHAAASLERPAPGGGQ